MHEVSETIALLANDESVRDLIASEAGLARGEVISEEELAAATAARRRHVS